MTTPTTLLSIAAFALTLSGCAASSTASESQAAIIGSGSAYYPGGCITSDSDGDSPRTWEGPVYILPADTYRELLLTL